MLEKSKKVHQTILNELNSAHFYLGNRHGNKNKKIKMLTTVGFYSY